MVIFDPGSASREIGVTTRATTPSLAPAGDARRNDENDDQGNGGKRTRRHVLLTSHSANPFPAGR
jgi:hypothetical protein